MSCYLVNKSTIDAILTFAIKKQLYTQFGCITDENATEFGQRLWTANNKSVNSNYAEQTPNPEYCFEPRRFYKDKNNVSQPIRALTVISLLKCLRYQSCDTLDWTISNEREIIQDLINGALDSLAGINDEPWGLND